MLMKLLSWFLLLTLSISALGMDYRTLILDDLKGDQAAKYYETINRLQEEEELRNNIPQLLKNLPKAKKNYCALVQCATKPNSGVSLTTKYDLLVTDFEKMTTCMKNTSARKVTDDFSDFIKFLREHFDVFCKDGITKFDGRIHERDDMLLRPKSPFTF